MSMFKWGCSVVLLAATYSVLKPKSDRQLPVNVGGFYHPAFKPLADTFREQVESGKERGGAFAVYHDGELVFDMWGGYADVDKPLPWKQDTIATVFSVSKGVAATIIASLADKGLVDYKRPVMDYWPEFGQNGKENITVEMLLSHQAGLPYLDEPVHMREILDDPSKVEKILASQKTVWPAGSKMGYHMITYGLYVDVLIRKLDPKGRSSTQLFVDDIAQPLGIDAYMNCPKDQFHRAATIYSMNQWRRLLETIFSRKHFKIFGQILLSPNSYMTKAAKTIKDLSNHEHLLNEPHIREVTMSAGSGTGTARAYAKLYGILANGGRIGNSTFLSSRTLSLLSEPLRTDTCAVTTIENVTFGRGMWFNQNPKGQYIYGHPGHGGNIAFADPINKLGYSYITNYLSIYGTGDDPRFLALQEKMYECLEQFVKMKH